jgi:hypothetical protein
MKTKLSRIAALLATVAVLPLVQGCYGDKVNVAAAWVPELGGIIVGTGAGATTTASGGGTTTGSGASGGGGYIP